MSSAGLGAEAIQYCLTGLHPGRNVILEALRRLVQALPPRLLPFARRIDRLNRWIGKSCYLLVLLMIALGVWNVIGRFLGRAIGMNLTSNALIEGQWYVFTLVFMLGAAYTLLQDGHVRVDVFYTNWSPRKRAIANLLGTIVFLIPFCILASVASWGAIANSWSIQEMSPDPGGLPRYPLKTMTLVSFGLLLLQGIAEIIKNWAILTGHSTDTGLHNTGIDHG
ncbi:MAG: TRAP transporter small permease subunit [Alkalinema sp. RL_2_19]|nr:TRAP transporter small permease subunit [Alkalinema sp. RL_2_19]